MAPYKCEVTILNENKALSESKCYDCMKISKFKETSSTFQQESISGGDSGIFKNFKTAKE